MLCDCLHDVMILRLWLTAKGLETQGHCEEMVVCAACSRVIMNGIFFIALFAALLLYDYALVPMARQCAASVDCTSARAACADITFRYVDVDDIP